MVEELIFVEQVQFTYDRLIDWCKNNPKAILMFGVCENPWFAGMIGKYSIFKPCAKIGDSLPFYKLFYGLRLPNPLGLHVHMLPKDIEKVSYNEQYRQIKYGKDLLESIGIKTKDFSSGWWNYNSVTLKVCHDLGFEKIYIDGNLYDCLHDITWLI